MNVFVGSMTQLLVSSTITTESPDEIMLYKNLCVACRNSMCQAAHLLRFPLLRLDVPVFMPAAAADERLSIVTLYFDLLGAFVLPARAKKDLLGFMSPKFVTLP
jgi:hypothetical protein